MFAGCNIPPEVILIQVQICGKLDITFPIANVEFLNYSVHLLGSADHCEKFIKIPQCSICSLVLKGICFIHKSARKLHKINI